MSHKSHGNPVATYVITALILGVITYVEFALVEYEFAWLSSGWILFWLFALSIAKFIMVIAIFMHLKDDEKTYTGFFSSGLVIALATFMILPLLFTVRTSGDEPQPLVGAPIEAHEQTPSENGHGESTLSAEEQALVDSNGYSRAKSQILDTPPPSDRSLAIQPPLAAEPRATLREPEAAAQAAETKPADQAREAGGEDETAAQPAEAAAESDQGQAEPEQAAVEQADAENQVGAAEDGPDQAAIEFDRALGQSSYATCQGCHGSQGEGTQGFAPPLAGNMAELYNAGGREYLIDVIVHGLSGEITVEGQNYNGNMPAWGGSMSNEQIAAVLNHELTAWGNEELLEEFAPIASDEVADSRSREPGNLAERRAELPLP